ncbi:MAG: rubredoxin [Bacteroidota bacterium]
MDQTIFINFSGGIISPGTLLSILIATSKAGITHVRFGLRQQLLIEGPVYRTAILIAELELLGICYEIDQNNYQNIISSYPSEEIFPSNSWVTEGVYKDILDAIDFRLSVKVNICNANQSFTPILTGNINWIASPEAEHYWHLIVRFPKTNVTYEWDQLVYTNSIPKLTAQIEKAIFENYEAFFDNNKASGSLLFSSIDQANLILKPADKPINFPPFNLPYYEGLNKYNNNKYWLGIYRRDEMFNVTFLKKICSLCLDTKLGQLCCTSWKTIIIKGIAETEKGLWNRLLEEFQVNMRHAANELNFQVEDHCAEGLAMKHFLVKHLGNDDTRTFGICFGIKTRRKSEVYSSILIRRRYLINVLCIKLFAVYDILCAKDFNPNERTGEVFSSNNLKFMLPEQLRRAVIKHYHYKTGNLKTNISKRIDNEKPILIKPQYVHQCPDCLSIYSHLEYNDLPENESCTVCETEKKSFVAIENTTLIAL